MLVDNIAEYLTLCFMDDFSGYNQIKMAEEDKKKIDIHYSLENILLQSNAFWFKKCWGKYQ